MTAGIDSGSCLRRTLLGVGAALLLTTVQAAPAAAQDFSARVWLDRGHEPVLRHGERVRVYYRTSRDAYVAIFHLDTNGTVRLLFPRSPHENHYVRGGRDYRMLFPRTSHWIVDDDPGVGYFFAVASPEPFHFDDFGYSARFAGSGWDLGYSMRSVYHDPYVAMDDFVAALVPAWRYVPYALDFATYNVGRSYDYPRFLCYDCHGFRTFSNWNPYLAACTSFRVVIYNDPYYYPAYRYRGFRVVYARPVVFRQPRFTFKERGRGESAIPIVQTRPAIPVQSPRTVPARRSVDVRGAETRRPEVQPPPTRSARPREASPTAPPTRTGPTGATPTRGALPGSRPSGADGRVMPPTSRTPDVDRGRGTVADPRAGVPARPTQVLPGRTNPTNPGGGGGAIDLRRRPVNPTSPPATGTARPSTGVPRSAAPGRIQPTIPGSTAPARPPAAQGRIPSRSSPPVRSLPPTRVIRPGASGTGSAPATGPVRTGPPVRSNPPVRAAPPVRTGPPGGTGSTPPRRPVRVGGGGGGPGGG